MINTITDEILGEKVKEQINAIWKARAKQGKKIPYVVEEAAFNSIILSSISRWIMDNEAYEWFAVSEPEIKRYGSKGYADIMLFSSKEVHYFELKGASYNGTNPLIDVKNTVKSLNDAQVQIDGISWAFNEKWYEFNADIKVGWCIGMICSFRNEHGNTNYRDIEEEIFKIQKESNSKRKLYIFATEHFNSIRYNQYPILTDGEDRLSNDGYFIIGYRYEMKNKE